MQRAVREHHDRLIGPLFGQIGLQPLDLFGPEDRCRVGGIVERDEVHALVIESLVQLPVDHLQIGFGTIERGVVFTVHITHRHVETPGHIEKLAQTLAAHFGVVGGLRQVTGEHHEIRLLFEGIHRSQRFGKRASRIRVHFWIAVAPVDIGQLHKAEIRPTASHTRATRQRGGEHQAAAHTRHFDEIPPAAVFVVHDESPGGGKM